MDGLQMIKVFDMFAGYGGAEFALKKAGIEHECIGFSEIDKYAIQCFKQNHGEIKNYGDCRSIDPNILPDFDLLAGGFPCQSFSVAGKGLGEQDTRGTLFYDIIRIAEVKKPKYMLLENVKGLTFKKHKDTFNKILSELDRIGYKANWKILNSKDYGIPQNRERVFFVCFRKELNTEFTFPEPIKTKLTLSDILLVTVDSKYYLTEKQIKILNNKLKNKADLNKIVSDNSKILQYRQGHTMSNGSPFYFSENTRTIETLGNLVIFNPYNGKNSTSECGTIGTSTGSTTGKTAQILIDQRMDKNEVIPRQYIDMCPTLLARARTDETPIIKNQFRKLTPKECFRLMGFVNDEINLDGLSDTQLYKLAGNGWDINLVSIIFKEMFKK